MAARELNTILYVEDEPDIQTVAKLALEIVGRFKVLLCNTGDEALRQLETKTPDLILLDVMMPGMDGPSTLGALRKNPATAGIPVVFMTAKVQPHEIAHYKTLGALDVIVKPFDPMTLASQIRGIWDTYLSRGAG